MVIDFGVARLMSKASADKAFASVADSLTQAGDVVGVQVTHGDHVEVLETGARFTEAYECASADVDERARLVAMPHHVGGARACVVGDGTAGAEDLQRDAGPRASSFGWRRGNDG